MYPGRIAGVVLMVLTYGVSAAEPVPVVRDTYVSIGGVGELHLDGAALAEAGLAVSTGGDSIGRGSAWRGVLFELESTKSPFRIVLVNGDYSGVREGALTWRSARVRVAGSSGLVFESESLVVVRGDAESAAYEFGVYGEGRDRVRLFDLTSATVDYESDSDTALLDGDLHVSAELASVLGMDEVAGALVGRLVVSIRLALSESRDLETVGAPGSAGFGSVGPDVIVGRLASCQQFGRVGTIGSGTVGLAIGTDSCNKGDVPFHWFALPNGDHPMIPQHLYRLKTVNGSERFEQLGYSWMKHGFTALQRNVCGFGCISSGTGTLLGVGCSDPYSTGLNASQCGLGPRSVINPYTGVIPVGGNMGSGGGCGSNYPSRNHRDHVHTGISHRIQVLDTDLLPELNDGARYFGEGQYLNPHEFDVANGNQNNNVSRREFGVTGPDGNGKFSLPIISDTVRESPAIDAWAGASQSLIEPEPMVDGRGYLASKVTDLGGDQWHYEYAVYNMNLDRSFGWFQIPVPVGVTVTNVGFHQPLHHAPDPNTDNYGTAEWSVSTSNGALTWSTDSFLVDPLANSIRFGTLYNFRFDADAPPEDGEATVGLFKTLKSMNISAPVPAVTAPTVVHGSAVESFSSIGFGGYVDPRAESNNGNDVNLGVSEVTFHFSTPVEDASGGRLTTASFVVRETGAGRPPSVVEVSSVDNLSVRVSLSRVITVKEWTTVEARVRSIKGGLLIANLGDQGPGMNEPDRIDIASLPFDIDQNGAVQPFDLLRYRQMKTDVFAHPRGVREDYIDTDRSGTIAPIDLLRFRQLWSGTGTATQAWAGERLNHDRP